jgi:hypothetical protein
MTFASSISQNKFEHTRNLQEKVPPSQIFCVSLVKINWHQVQVLRYFILCLCMCYDWHLSNFVLLSYTKCSLQGTEVVKQSKSFCVLWFMVLLLRSNVNDDNNIWFRCRCCKKRNLFEYNLLLILNQQEQQRYIGYSYIGRTSFSFV